MIVPTAIVRHAPRCLRAALLSLVVCAALPAKPTAAQQTVADFYKGKQLRFIIRSEAGGGDDLASRLIARHIDHHISSNPSVIPQASRTRSAPSCRKEPDQRT